MYLTYVDESGKPEQTDPQPEYVLASLTINESSWVDVDRRVRELKQRHFPDANYIDIELHATDILHHRGPFKNMSLERRLTIFREVLDIISEVDCCIVAIIIRKDEISNKNLKIDALALKLLFDRICFFLDAANEGLRKIGDSEQYGILLIDSVNQKYDCHIRSKIRSLLEDGTKSGGNSYLIEEAIFVDSKYRHLSQLVDCAAYCIRRNFRKAEVDERERETFESLFKIIEPKLLRIGCESRGYGLKIFPK